MFTEIVKSLNNESGKFDTLVYYLERHIEIDSGEHGPIALKMVEELCGNDSNKWIKALSASKKALEYRLILWDYILVQISKKETVY